MTVTYTAEVATCQKFGCFVKLLGRWKGSIYKLMWRDVILFLTIYYGIHGIYFYLLEDRSKTTFESVVYYCANHTSLIPLSFVLGFYVNLVMSRWWEQYMAIPWPDSIAVFVSAHVHGQDEGGRIMRRTVMRYVCLCLTIAFTMISPGVKKRFPKLKNLVDAGLLLENEKNIIEAMDSSFPRYPKHWMPIVWAASIITRARKEGRIRDDFAVKTIIDELNSFRGRSGTLMYYDFISIPLVYTQVVTIAVYSFFVCTLLAHQWTESKKDSYEALDFYSPVFITLQFFFYMGWLKVAETLINPFGEDDDDFEVNWMIDRNLQVSYLIVDEMHHEHPELVKDQYWDEIYPNELPYENEVKRDNPPEPSTAKYDVEPSVSSYDIGNEKGRISLTNAFNQRSHRFNEAFQRFLNNAQEDVTVEAHIKATHADSSWQSVTDVENVKNITRYDVELQMESETLWQKSQLESATEENDEVFEALEEEEIANDNEEEGQEEEEEKVEAESSKEPDTETDPFELLRLERQRQREQRIIGYLERYFGTNFQIVTQPLLAPENQKSKENKTKEFEKSEEAVATGVTEQKSKTEIKLLAENVAKENMESEVKKKPESLLNLELQEESLKQTPLKSQLKTQHEVPPTVTVENLTKLNESTTPLLSNYELFWQSKATSPLGSARSISTQSSSIADEWELLSARSSSAATEYRVDIEETNEETNSSKKD